MDENYKRRVARVEIPMECPAHLITMIFAKLPDDAYIVRVQSEFDSLEHNIYFRSSRFKAVPRGESVPIIKPTYESHIGDDDRRVYDSVEIEWPIEVDFPALRSQAT